MATIKLKRSETSGDEPSTSDLETGEVAVNIADYVLFTKNSAGAITKIANYAEADTSLIFPTGDYGSVADAAGTDAFGQQVLSLIHISEPTRPERIGGGGVWV